MQLILCNYARNNCVTLAAHTCFTCMCNDRCLISGSLVDLMLCSFERVDQLVDCKSTHDVTANVHGKMFLLLIYPQTGEIQPVRQIIVELLTTLTPQ